MQQPLYASRREDVLVEYGVREDVGLSHEEAQRRLLEEGGNDIPRRHHLFGLRSLLRQVKNPLVVILLVALAATVYLNEHLDAWVIFAALVINISIGILQELRASKAFSLLLSSQEHSVLVLRDGARTLVPSAQIVRGDIVVVEAGSVVPADGYLLVASDLSVSEAHLTGEATPVEKQTGVLAPNLPLYERSNMLYMGSTVLSGTGRMVVTAVGKNAEVGAIAESLNEYRSGETPVEQGIERLARFIAFVVLGVVAALFVIGVIRDLPLSEVLLLAIALAVSAVPEGLPAAVTAILAIGMEKILHEKGLVKNLLAAETLGSTTVILSDKTGTLTEASMRVVGIVSDVRAHAPTSVSALTPGEERTLSYALYTSDASVLSGGEALHGRPVERAVASFALDAGLFERLTIELETRLDFLKFSSEHRFAAAIGVKGGEQFLCATGAPEFLLDAAAFMRAGDSAVPFTPEARAAFGERIAEEARGGRRLIGVLSRSFQHDRIDRTNPGHALAGGVFEGLIVLDDPVRQDVPRAVAEMKRAGVRVVMVTGDAPQTAEAIAVAAGIAEEGERAVMGDTLDSIGDRELADLLMSRSIFARVLPAQKKRLVEVLTARGEVVAMTGDGVNDAPALKAAAIGIAVGSGTAVAREVADLVLLGDSFAILVAAVREGRRIMDNLKKTVTHLVATNFHEVFLVLFAIAASLPLPLLPIQILWINILQGGLLNFAFAFEPAERDVMSRSPRSKTLRNVLTREVAELIVVAGLITGIFSVALYVWLVAQGLPIEQVRSILFVMISLDALFFSLSLKRLHAPVWTAPLFNNRFLLGALALAACGVLLTFSVPMLREILGLVPLSAFDFAVLTGVALVNLFTIEFSKRIAFRRLKTTSGTLRPV